MPADDAGFERGAGGVGDGGTAVDQPGAYGLVQCGGGVLTRDQALIWFMSHPDRIAAVCPYLSPAQVEAAVRDALAALSYACGSRGPNGQCILPARHGEFDHEDSLGGRWPVDRQACTGQAT